MVSNPQMAIYALRCRETGNFISGTTTHGTKCWHHHLSALRQGKHRRKDLQEDYDTHGRGAFEWAFLETYPNGATQEYMRGRLREVIKNGLPEGLEFSPCRRRDEPHDPVAIERMRAAKTSKMQPIEAIDPNTNEVTRYASIGDAVRDGFNRGGLWQALNGKYKSGIYRGYRWRYVDEQAEAQ